MERELFAKKFVEFTPVYPIQHCVYLLMLSDEIVYAGKTTSLSRRVLEHARLGKEFDSVLHHNVDSDEAASVLELAIIKHIEPVLNVHSTKRHGVKGNETHRRMRAKTKKIAESRYENAIEILNLPLGKQVKDGLIAHGFTTIASIQNATYADLVEVRHVSIKVAGKILTLVNANPIRRSMGAE